MLEIAYTVFVNALLLLSENVYFIFLYKLNNDQLFGEVSVQKLLRSLNVSIKFHNIYIILLW